MSSVLLQRALSSPAGENELKAHLGPLLLELEKILNKDARFATKRANVTVNLRFRYLAGDHHALGYMLAKKMASAPDRCLFSFADLVIAAVMHYFGRPVFWLRKHQGANQKACEALHDELADYHVRTGKKLTKAEVDRASARLRTVFGNTGDVPVFCRTELAIDEHGNTVARSLTGLLDWCIVVPPVFHIQARSPSTLDCFD
jgi:hypothetical protein